MRTQLLKLLVKARVLGESHGQDLIEYVLVAALIALAATAGMSSIAGSINTALGNIGTTVTSYT